VLIVLGTADAVVVDVVAEEEEVLLFVEVIVPAVDVVAEEEEAPFFVDVIVPAAVDAAAEDVLLLADVLVVVGVETMPV
jgi:hypothetical protein